MRFVRGLLIVVLAAAGAVAADRFLIREPEPTSAPASTTVEETEPGPSDPPLVWIDGEVEEVTDTELFLREGERGPRVRVERFAGEATRFYRLGDVGWTQVPAEEAVGGATGEPACVEALLDGETFLAVRVFLGADCRPL